MSDAMDYSHSLLPRERTYRLRAVRVIGRVGRDRALGFSGSSSFCQRRHHIASRLQQTPPQAGCQCEFSHPVGTSVSREPRVTPVAVERQNRILMDLPLDDFIGARPWSRVGARSPTTPAAPPERAGRSSVTPGERSAGLRASDKHAISGVFRLDKAQRRFCPRRGIRSALPDAKGAIVSMRPPSLLIDDK